MTGRTPGLLTPFDPGRVTAMDDAIFTHPLLAEGLNSLFAMFDA